jgi:hypothetical protein
VSLGARAWLGVAAVVEAVSGLALLVRPALVTHLLFGYGVTGAGIALARVAGLGLLSLGTACWPLGAGPPAAALRAMLVYNLATTAYLAYLGFEGQLVGSLLWPAAAYRAVMTGLLARACFG